MGILRQRLAKRLVALRGTRSQLQYSKEIGLSNSTLRRLEEGVQNVTLDVVEGICERLGCDVVELLAPEGGASAGARPRRKIAR